MKKIEPIILWPETINIKADNGKYLSRIYYTQTGQNNCEAIKDNVDTFCTFHVESFPEEHKIALKGDNGKYLSRISRGDSNGGYIQYTEFEKDKVDEYCKFYYICLGGNKIALLGDTGLYLSRIYRNGRNNIEVAKKDIDLYSQFIVDIGQEEPNVEMPVLTLKEKKEEPDFTRFMLKISNYEKYPDELFSPAPDLPPCGSNHNASRTWVDIYNGTNNQRIYGFCALNCAKDLTGIWFAIRKGQAIPEIVYIKMTDRRTGTIYQSNNLSLK